MFAILCAICMLVIVVAVSFIMQICAKMILEPAYSYSGGSQDVRFNIDAPAAHEIIAIVDWFDKRINQYTHK